ncbi:MAG: hypothetical protein KatS3mg057_2618 [Herpetosiphonaceae bacterium]|nr:MAG: hypothetical protein KatS3mg057_2618 [Herpetosiphonaceae bacterium]
MRDPGTIEARTGNVVQRAAGSPEQGQPLSQRLARSAVYVGLSLVAYLILALLLVYPLSSDLGQVSGSQIARADAWQKIYFFWWARYALEHRTNPFFTSLLYAPHGARLELEPILLPLSVPTLPIQYLFGPVVAYNAATVIALVLNGLSLQMLTLRWVRDRLAAFIAGGLWLASPIALSVIWHGQLEKAAWFGIPVFILLLLEIFRAQVSRRLGLLIVAAALVFVTIALLGLYVFLFTAIFCAIFTVAFIMVSPENWKRIIGRGLLVAIASGAIFWIIFGSAIRALPPSGTVWVEISRRQGADLLDLFLPFILQPARFGAWHFAAWPHTGNWQSAAGYTLLALALFGLYRSFRAVRLFFALGLVMLVVGLGASLRVAGIDTGIPLPYRLIEGLPGVNISRYPQLALIFTHMMLAVIAAYGFKALSGGRLGRWRIPLAGLMLLAIVVEYGFWRVDHQPVEVAPAFERLGSLQGEGSVLPLPNNHDIPNTMIQQISHRKPIWGGYLARIPPYYQVEYVPILRQLWRNRPGGRDIIEYTPEDLQTILRFYGIGYVTFDKTQATAEAVTTFRSIWRQVSDEPPLLADEGAEVFRVPLPQTQRPQPILLDGWWEVMNERRWMSKRGRLRLINPASASVDVTLRLSIDQAPTDQLSITWQEATRDILVQPGQIVEIPLSLPPGEHELRLTGATRPRQLAGVEREVSVEVSRIELLLR